MARPKSVPELTPGLKEQVGRPHATLEPRQLETLSCFHAQVMECIDYRFIINNGFSMELSFTNYPIVAGPFLGFVGFVYHITQCSYVREPMVWL